ncbi:putative transcriptional regulatory C3C7.04-like protein [Cladobotryum mycophilum]|uniref:Transcriptional regulatory C3C7.04-like protein n=1 Tax=Cladobotryum mycophilum TaxID=491253 RepID=A0ABR0SK62_9HYPO
MVKVSQQYVDELIAENQRLQRRVYKPGLHPDSQNGDAAETVCGAELASTPWFINTAVPHTPILVAEASDSAFATRFRQAMSDSDHSHIPRVNYPSEEELMTLSETVSEWPTPAQARLLVSAALKCLGRWHHIVRSSVILDELERNLPYPKFMGCLLKSKFLALFAIGKMYSTRTSAAPNKFPGLDYFAKATKVLRAVSERPTVEMVETWLLLSFYSLSLNRRHSAYNLAGSAVRVAIIMGLHLNVPEPLLTDQAAREHRIRVWWTAYTFDRMWATILGYPVAIQDSDIDVDLPSNKGLLDIDFADCAYSIAMIGLAMISGRIIHSIYGKRSQHTSLSQRVHDSLSALRQWLKDLPPSLQMDPTGNNTAQREAESLHLLFNQLVMLATRPVLLHVFRTRLKAMGTGSTLEIPGSASALSDACVRCARHSCQILTDSWISGSFMMFDYFYTRYLFTAATVLAISSLLNDKDSKADGESFETAVQFLSELNDNGNFAAAEFKQHIDAMKVLFVAVEAKKQSRSADASSAHPPDSEGIKRSDSESTAVAQDMTADMVLSESFFHDLLEQPMPDLEFIDASLSLDSARGFYWPMVVLDSDPETPLK